MEGVKALVMVAWRRRRGEEYVSDQFRAALRSKRAQVCGAPVAAGHDAASGARPKQHRRDDQRSRALPERPGIGLHASGRQGLAPERSRLGARRSLSAVAEGAASGGAGTNLVRDPMDATVKPPADYDFRCRG
jgi:hypothetical protein